MQVNYLNNVHHNLEQYVVQKNDSLYLIAKRFNVTVEELKSYNHLVSNMIYPNQILFIPKKVKENKDYNNVYYQGINIVDNFKNKYDIEFRHNEKYYEVKPNDKIEELLAKFQLSPLDFLKLNEKDILQTGKKIIISN